jgi:hypothetical protein
MMNKKQQKSIMKVMGVIMIAGILIGMIAPLMGSLK